MMWVYDVLFWLWMAMVCVIGASFVLLSVMKIQLRRDINKLLNERAGKR